ncbi:MAG: hypothetical protein V1914_01630 [archaeon]
MSEKKLSQILREDLVVGKWYVGRGRNSNVGYWDGNNFLTIGFKFDRPNVKVEGYYLEDDGRTELFNLGCFQPFLEVDEGEMVEPFGTVAWDKHYGKTLEVK